MSLTITKELKFSISDSALNYFNDIAKTNKQKTILIKVTPTGCSGWQYEIDIKKPISQKTYKKLEEYSNNEFTVYVDTLHFDVMDGTCINIENNDFGKKVVFSNSKAKSYCGCGESFNFDK